MKITKVKAQNFGSYDHFEMDFENLGLALIHGATGSGKSTIMDMVCYGLYGVTSKNGAVEDVRTWSHPTRDTILEVHVEGTIVTRIRGKGSRSDLSFSVGGRDYRGKDMRDTQSLLNAHLGVDSSLFTTISYFSEFNESANFFLSKSKERRDVFNKVTSLTYPNQLAERISDAKKETRKMVTETERDYAGVSGQLSVLRQQVVSLRRQDVEFEKSRLRQLQALAQKADTYDDDKRKRIESLQQAIDATRPKEQEATQVKERIKEIEETIDYLKDEVCGECGQNTSNGAALKWQKEIMTLRIKYANLKQSEAKVVNLQEQLAAEEASVNQYSDLVELEAAKSNPFTSQTRQIALQLKKAEANGATLKETLELLQRRSGALEQLSDVTVQLRGILLEASIKECEEKVNELLSYTFDSPFQVGFTVEDDNLEVSITKEGYQASYKQLSKGQRRLLSLCFSVTIMEMAANASGIHMDLLMLDEATDGMDEDLKMKAHKLYEDLATRHESVLVIEHSSAAKGLFDTKYFVEMKGDTSVVTQE